MPKGVLEENLQIWQFLRLMKRFQKAGIPIFLIFLASALSAESQTFFAIEKPIAFTLEAPITKLKKQRGENPDWLEGTIALQNADGSQTHLDVKIKARGNFRRLRTSCSFPSFWINFKKKQVRGTAFEGLDKVKIVAHCRETREGFEPYIHKEYLAYKTYNLLTNFSFQVRLAEITYIDSKGRGKPGTFVAFFIEHVDNFAKRHNGRQVKERYILPELYDPKALSLAEMYQYFVGNTDFSFFASEDECCHNGKVFEIGGTYIPVAYDFDATGLVNVPYAKVNPKLPIKSVKDRIYRGIESTDEVFNETLNRYMEKKEAILDLWKTTPLLEPDVRKEALGFIEEFYAVIEDPLRRQNLINGKMRSFDSVSRIIEKRSAESGN